MSVQYIWFLSKHLVQKHQERIFINTTWHNLHVQVANDQKVEVDNYVCGLAVFPIRPTCLILNLSLRPIRIENHGSTRENYSTLNIHCWTCLEYVEGTLYNRLNQFHLTQVTDASEILVLDRSYFKQTNHARKRINDDRMNYEIE